jgi:hypothetical protein
MWLKAAGMWSKNLSHLLMNGVWWGGCWDGQRLVVGGEMERKLNKDLRKEKKVEAIPSKIQLSRPSPHWPCNSRTPLRGVRSYYAGAAIGAVM